MGRHGVTRRALGALALVVEVSACTYDFDAPFAGGETTSSQTGGDGGEGGEGSPTSTASSSPTSTGTGDAGGSRPNAEACDNGVDDDEDGDVDCADDACTEAGYACAPAAPEGFEGPVALVRGAPGVQPTCGGAFPDELVSGGLGALTADAPRCTACECGPPVGLTCSAQLSWYADVACTVETGSTPVSSAGCVDAPDVDIAAASASVATAQGGPCAPTGGAPDFAAATFEQSAKLCATAGGAGCAEGVCLKPPGAPFDAQLCVVRVGAGDCADAGPFTEAFVIGPEVRDFLSSATVTR